MNMMEKVEINISTILTCIIGQKKSHTKSLQTQMAVNLIIIINYRLIMKKKNHTKYDKLQPMTNKKRN